MPWPCPSRKAPLTSCSASTDYSLFPDRAGAVREMHRVLAPGGRALVIVLQALARHPVFEALMESVARHLSLPVSAVMTPFALCDADELRTLFTAAGFEKVDILPVSTTVRFPRTGPFCPACRDQFGGGGAGLHPTGIAGDGRHFSRRCAEKSNRSSIGTGPLTLLPFRCLHTLRSPPDNRCAQKCVC